MICSDIMRTQTEAENRLVRWMTEHMRLSRPGRKRYPRQRLLILEAKIRELEWLLGPERYRRLRYTVAKTPFDSVKGQIAR